MRRRAPLLTIAFLLLSCGGSSPSASQSPRASPTSVASSPSAGPLSGVYGLVLSAGVLQLIKTNASVAAEVPVATASAQSCSQQHDAIVAPPPVSASNDEVYFRDGDNKIRQVVPPRSAVDVTTVPGGPNVISFFSVSPDDQQIAVLVEDVSSGTEISERLYVEDLHGGGHHVDIYSTHVPKDKRGTTLFPMGWHQGRLVLAVWAACTFESGLTPNEWHVVDASTGIRQATIGSPSCFPGVWPSPAGAACVDSSATGHVRVFDWEGKLTATLVTNVGATELSPSGRLLAQGFVARGPDNPPPMTIMLGVDGSGVVTSPGHLGCLWMDDSHVLAQDAVIAYPSGAVTALAQGGACAGRFPGGL